MYRNKYENSASCSRQIDLINTFRKLWEEHVMWTRLFIISTIADSQDLDLVTKRLLQNPVDFSNVLRRFYGYDNAKHFEQLLTDHLSIAAKLLNDAKAGNTNAVDEDRKNWFANANEIADFLSGINPYWKKEEWQNMLYDHLRMTEKEATNHLTSQFASDITDFDDIQKQALKMADYMAQGIMNQFQI